jgi:hypothetical protein
LKDDESLEGCRGTEIVTVLRFGKMKRRSLLKELSVNVTILKLFLKKKMMPLPSISNSGQKQVADSHEHSNETSNYIKCNFLTF